MRPFIVAHGGKITWDELTLMIAPPLLIVVVTKVKAKLGGNGRGPGKAAADSEPRTPSEKLKR